MHALTRTHFYLHAQARVGEERVCVRTMEEFPGAHIKSALATSGPLTRLDVSLLIATCGWIYARPDDGACVRIAASGQNKRIVEEA